MKKTDFEKLYRITAAFLCVCICIFSFAGCKSDKTEDSQYSMLSTVPAIADAVSSEPEPVSSETPAPVSSATASKTPKAVTAATSAPAPAPAPVVNTNYKYNSNMDINNNVFLDALVYTGYNLNKHISDGKMWVYVFAKYKRALGWLSNIGYGGGSSGYETSGGLPDIRNFERSGLVCASYATYVYFNYLPNVAGIDTSSLPRPDRSVSANDWYTAAKKWINLGYSTSIPFTAKLGGGGLINFQPASTIPIGSILIFCDEKNRSQYGSHIAIYAGYKANYHWVFHVGNENGPEFCAVERMIFGPDPQWPIAVITTPSNIRMAARVELALKDDAGAPLAGVGFSLKNSSENIVDLGVTGADGKLVKEDLSYGNYELIQSAVPVGYTVDTLNRAVSLTTAYNSNNVINIVNAKIPPVEPPVSSDTTGSLVSSSVTSPAQ